jgi:hypothetical protein
MSAADTENSVLHHPSAAGPIHVVNVTDEDSNPSGGNVRGVGFTIVWQDGPRDQGPDGELAAANGAFVEDIIDAAISRLDFFQRSKYSSAENASAILHLWEARDTLKWRQVRRRDAGIQGAHQTDETEGLATGGAS